MYLTFIFKIYFDTVVVYKVAYYATMAFMFNTNSTTSVQHCPSFLPSTKPVPCRYMSLDLILLIIIYNEFF